MHMLSAAIRRILVVDDDREIRVALSECLREHGFVVDSAGTGTSALRQLRFDPLPDVVLLDLILPSVDGFEVAMTMRAEERFAAVPIVAISGMPLAGPDLDELRLAAFFRKPLELAPLIATLEGLSVR